LNEILAVVGHLDGESGAEAPRGRFRRFLLDLQDLEAARSLCQQAQQALGLQQHRALQDTVVRLGHFLGFETAFGTDPGANGTAACDGRWRSRHQLDVLLDLRTNQISSTSIENLSRSVGAIASISTDQPPVRQHGLVVVTTLYGGWARLKEAVRTSAAPRTVSVISLDALLWLAEAARMGRLTHDEIVRLLVSGDNLDFPVDLLRRFGDPCAVARAAATARRVRTGGAAAPPTSATPAYWIAAIGNDESTSAEQFIRAVVRGRHVLGVGAVATALQTLPDDWICFSLGAKYIIGHGRVEGLAAEGSLRASHRFTSVLRLEDVEMYDAPVVIRREALVQQLVASGLPDDAGPLLASVSREEFAELTVGVLEVAATEGVP
jgi:hypothetical protein